MGDAMRITPLDIQQMVFRVKLRGYDREEVNRFLEEIAQTVEFLNRDNAMLRDRIVSLEQQISELKRTEATLSTTLVSAQALAEDVKRSAQRDAEGSGVEGRRTLQTGPSRAGKHAARLVCAAKAAPAHGRADAGDAAYLRTDAGRGSK
ncbi:MAG: DivIVA domain-containing protein [Nitrospira sp. LK70]|nr:DivIVA domain-containing protein [Nitrospira sp. LK70]